MRALAASFALTLVLVAARASAQERPTAITRIMTTSVPLLEGNSFTQPLPNDRIGSWFEAYTAVHLPIVDSYTRSLDSAWQQQGRWKQGSALVVSMLTNLRMTREHSAPVRTPSYMPRARYLHTWSERGVNDGVRQVIVDGIIGHYSNGQDGCLFEGQSGPSCTFPAPVATRELRANRRDGSFSMNYAEVGATWRAMTVSDINFSDDRRRASRVSHIGIRYRDNRLLRGGAGGLSEELGAVYGDRRVRGTAGRSWEREPGRRGAGKLWLDGTVEALLNGAPQVDPVRVIVEGGWIFDRFQGLGVVARFYSGQDDYNLGFLTNLRVVHLGVALGGESRPSFRQ